ncbi:MAG: hypothetical protein ORN52_11705 [Beijerinckiaceae bacterium]|nr:hypothetical protein [Beijerinckiaceae bacterium]NDB68974.1 hypothetical protein [Methylocystaceae bacterium]
MANAAELVSQHLYSLVGDARRTGVKLEDITIELAAHAACAALAYWTPNDLHALIDVAQDDELFEDASQNDKKAIQASSAIIIPFPKLR